MAWLFGNKKQPSDTPPVKKKSLGREWLDAGVFAVVVATIIRTFFVEAYTIPTPSMEGSLLVNDFLFVSKMHYGARIPITPLAIPFVHNTTPIVGGKSYSDAVQWKYRRLPGFSSIKRYDDVVFNFPAGDSVYLNAPGYDVGFIDRVDPTMKTVDKIITHPIDKTENFIKRCVGMPGDQIEVRAGTLYVNKQPSEQLKHVQYNYYLRTKGAQGVIMDSELPKGLADLGFSNFRGNIKPFSNNEYKLTCSQATLDKVKQLPYYDSSFKMILPPNIPMSAAEQCWPHDTTHFNFNKDNFGPIVLPKKGDVLKLTLSNIALYWRLIKVYEQHEFAIKDSTIFIDGKPATSYTVQGNYYWLMGDNRHESLDSRFWGYVPETHIVGKAWFVWLSYEEKLYRLRWNRLFRSVKSLE
jgi:signal peptidase I